MTKNETVSQINRLLANDEILKAIDALLEYLQGQNSSLEIKLSNLKNKFIRLEEDNINHLVEAYEADVEKIKRTLYLYIQDLPEINKNVDNNKNTNRSIKPDEGSDPNSMWGFFYRLLIRPFFLLIVLGVLLLAYGIVRLSGRDPLCLVFKDCVPKVKMDTMYITSNKTWAEAQSTKGKKPYALLSVILHIQIEDVVENNKKIRKALYRTTYTLRALKDISIQDKVFLEQYSSTVFPIPIEQWAGSETQEVQSLGDSKYWVKFSAKSNEIKTLITGANYRYPIPLTTSNGSTCFNDERLGNDEWMSCYPNDEDYIDRLTIMIEGTNISISLPPNAAYRKDSNPVTSDAFCKVYPNGSRRCTIISTWEKINPGECVALKIRWDMPK